MPAGTSLNLAKSHKVATFEVTISMFELPQSRFGMSGVEDISFYSFVMLDRIALLATGGSGTNLCGTHTYSIGGRMRRYSCA
jgi:hypothetical protein